jgi:UDP-N-acetylmuramoyl-tripeptide--D-alanyl-D-alanine ligase
MTEDVLARFAGATFDSRQVKPGMLYVALKGERVDGHDFVAQSLAVGASCALVRDDWPCPDDVDEGRLIRVPDTRTGFGELARLFRRTLRAKVIGVTGSAGKTTVKELAAAFLRSGGFNVHATAGNFNNDLGLPLTVLNCPADADFLVVEMGTNHPGEIAYLADIASPDVGLISSIGTAHIEFFHTQDGIADEKGTLFARLPPDGFAVLARENDRHDRLAAMSAAPVVDVSFADAEASVFSEALKVRLPGRHNVLNALVAFGCARRFGVGLESCIAALKDFTLPGGRWRIVERDGVTFVDDTYNANPTSMIAALETFASLPCDGRRIVVLGDMFELGERAACFHADVGRRAHALALDAVVTVGPLANEGIRGEYACKDADEARTVLSKLLRPGDIVLLKASHGVHLDKVLQ